MTNNFTVVTGEVDLAINIMQEVAKWCHASGLNMWSLDSLSKEKLTMGLEDENFCVGKIGKESVCSMILQWNDLLFWPSSKENESGYIHKLCVKHEYSGIGLSGKMVEFAVEECKKKGIKYLRLDTGWYREKLCRHYESLGFQKVGKRILGDSEFALYEMLIK